MDAETSDLVVRLRALPALRSLDDPLLTELAAISRPREVARGELLVRAGDPADELYIVLDGRFAVIDAIPTPASAASHRAALVAVDRNGGQTVASGLNGGQAAAVELGAGSIVGEIAVLSGGTRSASLEARDDAEVAAIDGPRFLDLLEREPTLGVDLAQVASHRLLTTRLRAQLAALFPALGADDITAAVERTERVTLAPAAVLFHEGDPADDAYVVIAGRVRLLRRERDGSLSQPVPEVGAGELIGERALLDDQRRTATVVATRTTYLARIPRTAFESLMLEHPSAMLAVTRRLVQRHDDARTEVARARCGRSTIALVPLHPGVPLAELTSVLEAELQRHTSARRIDAAHLDAAVGLAGAARAHQSGPAALRVQRYLDDVEAASELVLLEADLDASVWSRRCVESADHVVLVADATHDAAPTPDELQLLAPAALPHQRVTLLLVHPPATDRPRGTAAWLEPRDLDDHLHLRHGDAADLARLARELRGASVWLALGGGGAKGFAHLGLVEAIREAGIPIDGVVGSSIGAALGSLVAFDMPTDELRPRSAELFHRLLDYTVPVSGMIAGRRIARAIDRGTDGRDIEDCWLPFRCVSTNLTRSLSVVHRRGALARAMQASLTIPGVMPAIAIGEDLHVDGGVMNNLPVDLARRETPTGVVIASDVAPTLGPSAKGDHGRYVRGGRLLARRMTPGMQAPRVPKLMPTLMRSLLAGAAHTRDEQVADGLADLYLLFELRGVGLLDFDAVDPVAQRGYDEAIEQVRTFAASGRVPVETSR